MVYDDWRTINGVISHNVTHMVTPAVVVSVCVCACMLAYVCACVCKCVGNLRQVAAVQTERQCLIIMISTAGLLTMQREARDHFNCSSLTGVELENQGGSGTVLSHWEKRILGVTHVSLSSVYIL